MVRKFYTALIYVLIALAAIPGLITFMKYAEPLVFPVVKDVTFERQVNGSWRVTFVKVRACKLEAVYWFNGRTWIRQAFVRQFTRPIGLAEIDGWPVAEGTNPATDKAIARHVCHPLYSTETVFNDPKRNEG